MSQLESQTFSTQRRIDVLFKFIMFTAAITGMAMISCYYPILANVPLIVIPSILVLLFSKPVFFEKLKLSTLVIMRILIVFAALKLFDQQLYVNIILWMLIVNILEATLTDLIRHKRYFNAISGFALTIGVVVLSGSWAYGAPVGQFYIVSGALPVITICYVAAYTLWNWIFVTNEFSPSVALMHVGFLSAPLIGGLCSMWMGIYGGLSIWLLLRANSLAIGGWLQIGAKKWFESEYYDPNFAKFVNWTKNTNVQIVFMIVNVSLVLIALFFAYQTNTIAIPNLFLN